MEFVYISSHSWTHVDRGHYHASRSWHANLSEKKREKEKIKNKKVSKHITARKQT